MKGYVYYQPNTKDLKDEFNDSPVRAVSKLRDLAWLEAYDDLVIVARELQCSIHDKICHKAYLTNKGYTYTGISNKKGSKRPIVREFAKSHSKGRYFLNVANYCVTIVDGCYYNTWDCGDMAIYGYWK